MPACSMKPSCPAALRAHVGGDCRSGPHRALPAAHLAVCITRCGCVVVCVGMCRYVRASQDVCRCACAGVYRYHGMGCVGVHTCTRVGWCWSLDYVILKALPQCPCQALFHPGALSGAALLRPRTPVSRCPARGPFLTICAGMHRNPLEGQGADDTPQDSKGSLSLLRVTGPVADLPQHAVQVGPGSCAGSASACAGWGSVPGVLAAAMASLPQAPGARGLLVPSVSQKTQAEEEGSEGGQQGPRLLVEAGGL